MTNLNRKEALKKGGLFYQGKPCKNDHSGMRYVKNHNCPECSKSYYTPTGKIGKARNPIRDKAIENKELTYINNKPCKFGHNSPRYTKNQGCVECLTFKRIKNKYKIKLNQIKRQFGLSQNQYEQLLETQNYNCAICQNKLDLDKHTHIDHCHTTNKVRGILCHWCNVGLGHFKSNKTILRAAALYCEASE